ncbi:MAG: class D sortase, partial [Acidobacteria bacterium]|nr:class D sortase [Acidobacteriota bacterium]
MANKSNSETQPGQPSRTLPPRRVLELASLVLGLALLAFYGLAMIHQRAGAAIALAQFDDSAPPAAGAASSDRVDFSLWDKKRVSAYLRSIPLFREEPVGVLTLARLNLRAPIFASTSDLALNRGLGWIEGTPKPGAAGNSGIAGHRDGFFRPLKDVRVGDLIELSTTAGRLAYQVDQISIVLPE